MHDEIAFLQSCGIAPSRMILVGFSQGAILVNTYLIQALQHSDELLVPAKVLAWAGSEFAFDSPFPHKSWCTFPAASAPHDQPLDSLLSHLSVHSSSAQVESHQQCGTADRYFTEDEIQHVALRIARVAHQAGRSAHVSVAMEPGNHSVLPGMVAKLIQMVQNVCDSHSAGQVRG